MLTLIKTNKICSYECRNSFYIRIKDDEDDVAVCLMCDAKYPTRYVGKMEIVTRNRKLINFIKELI